MKIIKHIPNTITSLNLLCGTTGVISALNGNISTAFHLMLLAGVCDFCDGLSARLLKAYSPLGKELDSLADLISFGLLPSLMLYKLMMMTGSSGILAYIPICITIFSAIRLAKFNIDDRQSDNFIGLPTPASALLCGSFSYYVTQVPDSILCSWAGSRLFIPIGSLILAYLLICEIPMFSMKFKKNIKEGTPIHKQRVSFAGVIFVSLILTLLLGLNWSMAVILIFTTYIIMNIGVFLLFRKSRNS